MGDASVGSGAGSVLLQSSLWNFLAVKSKAPFSAGPCSISKEMGTDFLQAMQSWLSCSPSGRRKTQPNSTLSILGGKTHQ